ncbi:MAG: hypothetical protein ACREXI_05390 [Caldimonas sp.]
MNQTIGEGRLAVIDVGDDREIADVVHCLCDVLGSRVNARVQRRSRHAQGSYRVALRGPEGLRRKQKKGTSNY